MLDIPGALVLDKRRLVGGCVRLPLRIDVERLSAEVNALPAAVWGSRGGRVGVHDAAEALFLRGFAPAEGEKPIEDRPALELLPYLRSLIEQSIPAQAQRCLLARLPPDTTIAPHIDRAPYFAKTLRLHLPVQSNPEVYMVSAGKSYCMRPGEVWALNNSVMHGVWNAHGSLSRTHVICDFLPSPALLESVAAGERELGAVLPKIEQHLANAQRLRATAGG